MKNRIRGMSLLELMIGISVLGILVGLGVPTFRTFTANSRVTAATNNLVTALAVARSEALRRSTAGGVCATTDGASCSGAADWSSGWLAFVDLDGDGVVGAADNNGDGAPDELLQVWPALEGNTTLMVEGGGPNVVGYNAMGMGTAAVTFGVTPPYCTPGRKGQTTVSIVGTVRSAKVGC
jgi:type IV fimbrial biogenesis protein FimT